MNDIWKTYKLGDIGTIVGGATPSTFIDKYYGGNIPWLTPKDLSNFHERYITQGERNITQEGLESCSAQLLPQNTILFSSRAPIGYVAIAKNPVATNQGFKSVIPNEKIVSYLFLYYLLVYNKNRIEAVGSGTTFKEVSASTMRNIPISLPPLETQKRIADILSAIDDKIELNRRITTNLEQQAQALYKSWFVDFEPFGGKMPEDWRVGTISNIVDLLNGFAFKSSDFVEKGLYKLITIKGVQDGNMSLDGADCLDIIPPKMPQWCKLKKEDILLSLTGNVGRCCLVDTENCLLNQRVAKLHPKEEYNRLFVYALFRQEDMKARMISIARGTAQMNLSPIETGKLPLIIPSNEVLKDFGNRFNNIIHTLTNNIVESSYLAQLRDTLLPKLMSGETKV